MGKEIIKEKFFNRGWAVKMVADGKGFSVKLFQFSGEVKSWFRFEKKIASKVFDQVCDFVKK